MKTIVLSSILGAALLTSCGGQPGPTEAPSTVKDEPAYGDVLQGAFKVYLTSREVPSAACDVHTKLMLANGIAGPIATLEHAVTGPCDLGIESTPRTFNLKEVDGECGTRRYTADGFELVDNRRRHCENTVEADLIVKEDTVSVLERHVTTTFYSFDPLY